MSWSSIVFSSLSALTIGSSVIGMSACTTGSPFKKVNSIAYIYDAPQKAKTFVVLADSKHQDDNDYPSYIDQIYAKLAQNGYMRKYDAKDANYALKIYYHVSSGAGLSNTTNVSDVLVDLDKDFDSLDTEFGYKEYSARIKIVLSEISSGKNVFTAFGVTKINPKQSFKSVSNCLVDGVFKDFSMKANKKSSVRVIC